MPEAVRNQRDAVPARPVFSGRESPADGGSGAEQRQKIGGHESAQDALRLLESGQVDALRNPRRDAAERVRVSAPVVEIGLRYIVTLPVRIASVDVDELRRVRIGYGFKEDPIDDAENRRIRPDAEGQRQNRRDGEPGRLTKRPGGVPKVLRNGIEEGP